MAENKFIPKDGQVDYTNIRYAPVINTVVTDGRKVLLVKRSAKMRLYPNYWNGISGFLDDKRDIEEKVKEELKEELGIEERQITSLATGKPLLQEAPKYDKTWLVVPVLARVKAGRVKLDWEASEAQWFTLQEAKQLDLLPGFNEVLATFF